MTNSNGHGSAWLLLILGVIAAGLVWASLDFRPTTVTGAPLPQATATATPTRDPTDRQVRMAGDPPFPESFTSNGDGTWAQDVHVVGGSVVASGFPTPPPQYTAVPQFTQLPYATAEPSRTPYSVGSGAVQPVQPNGAVAAQTPVAVAMAGQQVLAATTVVVPVGTPAAYAVGDVVTASTPVALAFGGVCRLNAGSGYVVGARLATDQAANTAAYRLWLYQSAPPTMVLDNAANTVLFADNGIRLGYIDIPNLATGTGSNTAAVNQNFDIRVPITCPSNGTGIVGILETQTAFTPASGQQFYVALRAVPD